MNIISLCCMGCQVFYAWDGALWAWSPGFSRLGVGKGRLKPGLRAGRFRVSVFQCSGTFAVFQAFQVFQRVFFAQETQCSALWSLCLHDLNTSALSDDTNAAEKKRGGPLAAASFP